MDPWLRTGIWTGKTPGPLLRFPHELPNLQGNERILGEYLRRLRRLVRNKSPAALARRAPARDRRAVPAKGRVRLSDKVADVEAGSVPFLSLFLRDRRARAR